MYNAGIHVDRQIVFRIGINVGDIIIDGQDIFGDGVNIAARLEALCEPGGVCISRSANEQIRDKLSIAFADLGEQMVKNIARCGWSVRTGGEGYRRVAGRCGASEWRADPETVADQLARGARLDVLSSCC